MLSKKKILVILVCILALPFSESFSEEYSYLIDMNDRYTGINRFEEGRVPAAVALPDDYIKEQVKKYFSFENSSGEAVSFKIVDSYGKTRNTLINGETLYPKFHAGWDIIAPTNLNNDDSQGATIKWLNPVESSAGGVTYHPTYGSGGANLGRKIMLFTHDRKFKLEFCHLANDDDTAYVDGAKMQDNTKIGKIGVSGRVGSGRTSPPHLHLEVYINVGDRYIRTDPLAYFMLAPIDEDHGSSGVSIASPEEFQKHDT